VTAALPGLAAFADVFGSVVGVVMSLSGLGILLMGLIAMVDAAWRRGALAAPFGAALLGGGLWLVGVF
jgi:hypothetical protein